MKASDQTQRDNNGIVRIIKNNWSLVTAIMLIVSIVSSYFISQAAMKDSIDLKIEKNDTLDCDRFAKKNEFTQLKTETKALAQDVDEIKMDVKEVKKAMASQMEILIRMEERLKRGDSL